MTDRLLEIATRPEGPSARAKLPFDKLARVLDVPDRPDPGACQGRPASRARHTAAARPHPDEKRTYPPAARPARAT